MSIIDIFILVTGILMVSLTIARLIVERREYKTHTHENPGKIWVIIDKVIVIISVLFAFLVGIRSEEMLK